MNKLTWLAFGALLILLGSRVVSACNCELPSMDKSVRRQVVEARANSSAVLVGKVLTVESSAGMLGKTVTLEVESAWKGTRAEEIIIQTGLGGGDCGFGFEIGAAYLVYAFGAKKTSLGTNECQRTTVYFKDLVDLKYLGMPIFRRRIGRLE